MSAGVVAASFVDDSDISTYAFGPQLVWGAADAGHFSGFVATNAVDKDSAGTIWCSSGSTGVIRFDAPVPFKVTQYTLISSEMKNYTFQGSMDGVSYTTLETVVNSGGGTQTRAIVNSTAYNYYQFVITAFTTGGAGVLQDILFNDDFLKTATASTIFPGFDPFDAINGGRSGQWWSTNVAVPQWLRVECAPGAKVFTEYKMGVGTTATAWTIQGSNDGSTWTTLHTKSGVVWSGVAQQWHFPNTTAYLYYLVTVTANTGSSTNIVKLQMA